MEKTVRSQSVKVNLDQIWEELEGMAGVVGKLGTPVDTKSLWKAIETLTEEVGKIKAMTSEVIKIPAQNNVDDILARIDTLEKVLWGTE